MHAISKIIARHADRSSVEVGEIVNVVPDYVMLNDRGAARAADLMAKMGADTVFNPSQVIVVFDHHYPPIRQQDSVAQKKIREWIKEQDIEKLHSLALEEEKSDAGFSKNLLDDRNVAWIPKLESSIKTTPSFIAVGAGHLGGKNGVIQLLRAKGYKITPIRL